MGTTTSVRNPGVIQDEDNARTSGSRAESARPEPGLAG